LPAAVDDLHAAPLQCAGLIGYRTWRLAGGAGARRIGLWGFGAAAHIVCQLAVAQGQEVHAFTRSGDAAGQAFARSLGASWAGGSDERPPRELDAALVFAPAGALVPAALATVRKGGVVVCGGILPIRPAVGRAGGSLGGQPHAPRRRGLHGPARPGEGAHAREGLRVALIDDLRAGCVEGAAVLVPWGLRQIKRAARAAAYIARVPSGHAPPSREERP